MDKIITYKFILALTTVLVFFGISLRVVSANPILNKVANYSSSSGDFIHACDSGQLAANTVVCSDVQKQTTSSSNIVVRIIKDAINIISYIVGVAAVIIIIISGFRMVISGGDSKTVNEARNGILAAVIGIVVVVFAQLLVVFVLNKIE